ncbi:MAG: AI-2E family transporter [Gemmatimonadota bacterium]
MRRIPVERSVNASLAILATLGVVALLYYAASVVITILTSLLVALALEPLVQLLLKRARLPRGPASMIVVFLAIALVYGILYLAYASAQELMSDLPRLVTQVREAPLVQRGAHEARRLTESLQEAGKTIAPAAPAPPGARTAVVLREGKTWIEAILQGLGSVKTVLFSLSFIPFLVYFILADKERLTRRTRELFPREHRETAGRVIEAIERMMQKYLAGNAIVAGILCAATSFTFLLVGLPYWLVLGILSGMLSMIPYLGLPFALVPPLVVGLVTFPTGGPVVVIVVVVAGLHLLAANLLIPRLVGRGARLNAVAATGAIMFFGWLWGGMGLILGIPIVAVAKCIMDNVPATQSVGRWLGD